ncbi:class I adenylate-forming enzyme family protein [Streptomyces sp. NPDC102384]|uniref:class I adenylate-forming enzyme family protein n=1 Tax=Streptomyces sp. NPDC102384 TaxID=3366166 RepID=UPI00382E689F
MKTEARAHPASPPLPLLSAWLCRVLELQPDARALHFSGTDHPWSYFARARDDLDALLRPYPQARRVGIVLRNRPGPLAAALAAVATGRQVVTLGPYSGDAALAEEIAELRPDAVIADAEDWARTGVTEAVRGIGAVAALCAHDRAIQRRSTEWTAAPACLPMEDTALSMTTSGTTGKPKRITLTYTQITAAFSAAGSSFGDTEGPKLRKGTVILWSSLTHISGLYFAIVHALEGRHVALMEKFDVTGWVGLVERFRPRFLRLPPTAIRMVLQAGLPPETFHGVRAIGSGTAPLSPELRDEFEQRYNVPVLVTYGATEFAGAVAGWTLADHREWSARKRGSVGRAHPGVELRVVEPESGRSLTAGQTGLLEVRGPQLPAGAETWIRTTDLASLDEDGFLYIHGRADQAINRGGFKIPPTVIEDALHCHEAVSDAIAVALPDDRLGEVPAAAVTLCAPATEDELHDHLAARLTRYQMPVLLRILEQMPRTSSLKISRRHVSEELLAARDDAAPATGPTNETPSAPRRGQPPAPTTGGPA